MVLQKRIWRTAVCAVQVAVLASAGAAALAQEGGTTGGQATTTTTTPGSTSRAQSAAFKHVNDAADVVRKMSAETGMSSVLSQAKGIFIVPTYGRAALGLGASGGAGVLLVKHSDGAWGDPAFFNIGGLSIGLQAGAEGGPIVLILNNDKAVNSFRAKNNFSLSADAGLTVVNWSKMARGSAGTGDIVAWGGTKGLFGNVATVAINDIRFNQRATQAYYGKAMTAVDVMDGKASNPHADTLKQALASASGTATK